MKYREYTDEDVIKFAAEVTSLSQLLEKLELKKAGGNYANMKRILQRLKVDCDHWVGQAWNKDKQLKDWSDYTKSRQVKKHLIRIKGHQCEVCLNTLWNNFPIPLELHHLDGDRTNNKETNLQLLCCNCHAQTDNWRARNRINGPAGRGRTDKGFPSH